MSRILTFFRELGLKIVRSPGRLAQLSVPAIAAIFSELFAWFCLLGFLVFVELNKSATQGGFRYWLQGAQLTVIVLLLILIPVACYFTARFWLEEEVSRFPDIDLAWKRGLAEMERGGLDITKAPIIVVLGGRDADDARALASDPKQGFRVRGIPEDDGAGVAMQWFAGKRSIVLVLTFVGQLCELAQLSGGATDAHAAEDEAPSLLSDSNATMMVGDPRAATPRSVRPQPSREGTAMIDGTMFVPSAENSNTIIARIQPGMTPNAAAQMNSDAAAEQRLRLRYLCRLLLRVRRPYCPINGLIALTPYRHLLLEADAVALETALRADLDVAFQSLMLRCPTAVLVTGMDLDPGFDELARRVGDERAQKQRFGKGFRPEEIWRPQNDHYMRATARHACAAFEDWTYQLFREPGALAQAGNRDLFALVCRMRGRVQERLMHLLESCFARTAGGDDRLLLAGCYFATLGARPSFAAAVVDKMVDHQGELEWTADALRRDARCRLWSKLVMLAAGIFLVSVLVAKFVFWPVPDSNEKSGSAADATTNHSLRPAEDRSWSIQESSAAGCFLADTDLKSEHCLG